MSVNHPWYRCLSAGEFLFGSSVSHIFVDSQSGSDRVTSRRAASGLCRKMVTCNS